MTHMLVVYCVYAKRNSWIEHNLDTWFLDYEILRHNFIKLAGNNKKIKNVVYAFLLAFDYVTK